MAFIFNSLKSLSLFAAICLHIGAQASTTESCEVIAGSADSLTTSVLETLSRLTDTEARNYLVDRGLENTSAHFDEVKQLFSAALKRGEVDKALIILGQFDFDPRVFSLSERLKLLFRATADGNMSHFRRLKNILYIDFEEASKQIDSIYLLAVQQSASADVIRYLHKFSEININAKDNGAAEHDGDITALMLAIYRSDSLALKALLERPDILVHAGPVYRGSILAWFFSKASGDKLESLETLKLLVNDSRFNSYEEIVEEAVGLAGYGNPDLEFIHVAVASGRLNLNHLEFGDGTPLHWAILYGSKDLVAFYLSIPEVNIYQTDSEMEVTLSPLDLAHKLTQSPYRSGRGAERAILIRDLLLKRNDSEVRRRTGYRE